MNYLNEADDAKYMANAHAQVTLSQSQIAKDYANSANRDSWVVPTSLDVVENANPAIQSVSVVPGTGVKEPADITGYVVTFTDGTKATVTINGSITIEEPAS